MPGMNLPLGFAMIGVGALAATVGFSKSHSFRDVLAGQFELGDSTGADSSRTPADRRPTTVQAATAAGAKSARDSTGAPISSGVGGFTALAGADFGHGQEPQIAERLGVLGRRLHTMIYGISGYRTPAHSVAVGGFADDPHTKGSGTDFGFGNATRDSAGQVSDSELASVGLYRPYRTPDEINHVELIR